jgi:hypothetical protein
MEARMKPAPGDEVFCRGYVKRDGSQQSEVWSRDDGSEEVMRFWDGQKAKWLICKRTYSTMKGLTKSFFELEFIHLPDNFWEIQAKQKEHEQKAIETTHQD